jgi:hypothetical protein
MRPELLKKLDDLIGKSVYGGGDHCHCYPMSESKVYKQWMDWQKIRAEIVAERCDACRWWCKNEASPLTTQKCEYHKTYMYPDGCCSDFEKK